MLHQTKGIVLHSIKYSETSVIVKIYTELFGLQSYLVKGSRSPKSKMKPGLFQPLTLLDMIVYHRESKTLQSVKEIHLGYPYHSIPFDIRKSSIALFINELLYKSIREEETNPSLFEYLWNSCLLLDSEETVGIFHLAFMVHLTHFLGIMPQLNFSTSEPVFNLLEGHFQSNKPEHKYYLDDEQSRTLFSILLTPIGEQASLHLKTVLRNQLLEAMIFYFQTHLPGFKDLRSHVVLHTVLT